MVSRVLLLYMYPTPHRNSYLIANRSVDIRHAHTRVTASTKSPTEVLSEHRTCRIDACDARKTRAHPRGAGVKSTREARAKAPSHVAPRVRVAWRHRSGQGVPYLDSASLDACRSRCCCSQLQYAHRNASRLTSRLSRRRPRRPHLRRRTRRDRLWRKGERRSTGAVLYCFWVENRRRERSFGSRTGDSQSISSIVFLEASGASPSASSSS